MYLTAAQLADRPGATELAQVATPQRDPVVAADLMQATLIGGDRSGFDPADVAVADLALEAITTAIGDASAVIDGYLAARYSLPLASTPSVLIVYARAITRYLLHKDRRAMESDDAIVRDYRDAMKFLELVSAGKVTLGAGDPTTADNGSTVEFVGDCPVFSRDQTRAFR